MKKVKFYLDFTEGIFRAILLQLLLSERLGSAMLLPGKNQYTADGIQVGGFVARQDNRLTTATHAINQNYYLKNIDPNRVQYCLTCRKQCWRNGLLLQSGNKLLQNPLF